MGARTETRGRKRTAGGQRKLEVAQGWRAAEPRSRDVLAVAALVAAHLAFFWRAAVLRGFLIVGDICYFFQPMQHLMHESLRAGRLPLWSPYIFAGYPVAAEGQIAAFYPLSLALSRFLPSPAAVNWIVILHLMLAGVGTYWLARVLGLRPFAAWLSGLVFSFSGYMMAHTQHVSLLCAAAWLPFTLVFVERAWNGPAAANAALAAIAWAAGALCGHPQTLFYISVVAVCWIAWRALGASAPARPRAQRALSILGITFGLGGGLSAVQILLTVGLSSAAPHGQRGDLGYITSFSLSPVHLVGLVAPNWQGTPADNTYRGGNYYWEYVLYLGLAPLVLAAVGGASRRGRFLAGLAIAAVVLALARGNPLYQVLRYVPGFADFRVPARFIFVFTFASSLLVGYGWEVLAQKPALAGRRVLAAGAAVALASFLDLASFGRTLTPLASPEVLRAPNPVARVVESDGAWGRTWIFPPVEITAGWVPPGGWAANPDGYAEARALLPGNVSQSYGILSLTGYAGFVDRNQAPFFNAAFLRAVQQHDLRLLSLVGTRYLAVGDQVVFPGLAAARAGLFTVYRNPEAFPRAFVVGDVVSAANPSEAHLLTIELADADRLRRAAVVRGDAGGTDPEAAGQPDASVESVRETRPERIVVRARSDRAALLVLNERWDRGWRARLDGRSVPVVEVDGVLMGARLPAGSHTVEFLYHPLALTVGRPLSLLSLAVCLGLIAWLLLPRGRRAAD